MNTTRYFKLGMFILICVCGLILGAIALGAGRMFQKSIMLQTRFNESISGLEVGAPVKYRGVTIGHVQSIRFPQSVAAIADSSGEPFKYILVDMAIDPDVVSGVTAQQLKKVIDQMVSDGLRARVGQTGITGSTYVELNYLDPARYPIAAVPVRTNELFIPSAPGAIGQVVDALTDIATKLQHADLEKIIQHVDSLIVHADQSVQDLQVAELRRKTGAILDSVQASSARLQEILDDPKLKEAISDLPEITGRVKSVATRTDELLKNGKLDQSAAHLQQTLAEADELLASQSDNVRSILTDLRATMANARELTEDVKSDPSRLLIAQPPPRTAYGSSK